jgi:hypothetical protein
MRMATPQQLRDAGVHATLRPSLMIETFEGDWEKEWFTYRPEDWARKTHKLYDSQWQAPAHANLAFEVHSEKPNTLVVGLDTYASEVSLTADTPWQSIVLSPDDFHDAAGDALEDWTGLRELRLGAQDTLRGAMNGEDTRRTLGAEWQGHAPKFRNLRWVTDGQVDE